MKIKKISSKANVRSIMQNLGVDRPGIEIMARKAEVMLFYLRDLHVGAANILKQDALSIGADLAVPNGTITCHFKRVDALLIGTKKHIALLAKKEMAQPYGLKELAKELRKYLSFKEYPTKIMGIINATDDSFYPGSRFQGAKAVEAIKEMIAQGADIIDIGGMSTRPGSEEISEEEELARIKPLVDALQKENLKVELSIDTYRPKVARYALERGFSILNDITALENEENAKIAAEFGATVVLMHKKGNPKTMQQSPYYEDVVVEVSDFFAKRIERAQHYGINAIILDPGIGFGKRLKDNIALIENLSEFRKFGYEVLIGASRKSMIDKIIPTPVEERLPGTLVLHLRALQEGANIVRCHDVKEHKQAIKVLQALKR
ncbi:dihydropteroate synthase [Nitratiruptor sp. YY08-26]|uniref:dihydropteroate synthase n=1 Tax=unclassified Nitratiruptor TaxID=2624044 RepID=UPI001915CF60|nr:MULTISPECIES: dihydropteroate synthase [unclassified Nitratiruptor]BCD61979.1 dihydropteroate synthase [Nitratiruptor sp. YY08-13]BCD65915.1 dihydropteroate synthase [Nitratiruptor sp. YY08-26]